MHRTCTIHAPCIAEKLFPKPVFCSLCTIHAPHIHHTYTIHALYNYKYTDFSSIDALPKYYIRFYYLTLCTVYVWCMYGACMVHVWCIFRNLYGVNHLQCSMFHQQKASQDRKYRYIQSTMQLIQQYFSSECNKECNF